MLLLVVVFDVGTMCYLYVGVRLLLSKALPLVKVFSVSIICFYVCSIGAVRNTYRGDNECVSIVLS